MSHSGGTNSTRAFGSISSVAKGDAVILKGLSELPWRTLTAYVPIQIAAAILGVWAAHLMFDFPVLQVSTKLRFGPVCCPHRNPQFILSTPQTSRELFHCASSAPPFRKKCDNILPQTLRHDKITVMIRSPNHHNSLKGKISALIAYLRSLSNAMS